jgi:hypothetical protein
MSASHATFVPCNPMVRMKTPLLALLAVLGTTACRNALLDTPQPVVRSTLAIHARTTPGDTVHLTLTLGTGPLRALGSVTAEVANRADWRFTGCVAAQGEPLLACKAHEGSVRVAAAWAAGTHTGDLITLTFVRTALAARATWQLSVQEAHGVSGQSLLEDLDVRADVTDGTP